MALVQTPIGPVTVRELTVAEIRDWLKDLATADPDQPVDLADWLLFEDEGLRLSDFTRLTNLSADELRDLAPSDLEAILAKCREVNPRFFLALGRVLALGRLSIQARNSTTSNAPARGWRARFTRMFGRGPGAA